MRDAYPVSSEAVEPTEVVWRYFDLPKFVSLLEEKALYFSRADLLGDPLEGSCTRALLADKQKTVDNPPNGLTKQEVRANLERLSRMREDNRLSVYVNCWHQSDHESMAMWKGYGNGPFGIAIRSTFGILDSVLPEAFSQESPPPRKPIHLGKVEYLDHSSALHRIPCETNVFGPFLCKSVAYQHEKEIRAVFWDYGSVGQGTHSAPGHLIPVDLRRLVQVVTVSPLAPAWYEDAVLRLCKQFGCDFSFVPSVAALKPIF
jgi:hypothetical protein